MVARKGYYKYSKFFSPVLSFSYLEVNSEESEPDNSVINRDDQILLKSENDVDVEFNAIAASRDILEGKTILLTVHLRRAYGLKEGLSVIIANLDKRLDTFASTGV